MKPLFPTLAVSCLLVSGASAQTLKEFHKVGSITADQLNKGAANLFGAGTLPPATQPVGFYRMSYTSVANGSRNATVSGMLVLPPSGAPNGLIVWNHGTIGNKDKAPSNYKPGITTGSDRSAILAFASGGYAIAMPDYYGFGDDHGSQPYPMGKINARSAIDIVAPARQIGTDLNRPIGPRTMITGYSQGGAVAMWAQRLLQDKGTPPFRTAALSGPYDLTGIVVPALLTKPANDTQFAGQLFTMGLIVEGFAAQRSLAVYENFFKPAMAYTIRKNFGRSLPEFDAAARVGLTAKLMGAKKMQDVLNPAFYQALQTTNTTNPLVAQLKASNCLEWTPTAPLLLFALESDGIVSAQNTVRAAKSFKQRGVTDATVRTLMLQNAALNHDTVVPQAVLSARRFFDGGFAGVPKAK